ncbi:hypothetical protein HHI36_023482 [Cryptolaemus montrouzieri]|uniref:Short-chain dehydrogenase/reductase 3 n=1 Tax=Cryptolaemus montrouzieri TaxID=559131 RepID=A0ABD2PGN9_9CUCU
MNEIFLLQTGQYNINVPGKVGTPHISEQIYQILELLFISTFWLLQLVYYIGESIYLKIYKPAPKSVEGEIVLITGTGHGIGKQLALQYAGAGATVVGWDINKENNDETIKEINQRFKNKAYGYICNVANRENVLETAKKVQEDVGDVTIFIANAGIMPCHLLEEHSANEIQRIIDINVMQIFWLLEAFLPSMKKNNYGHIVGISSIAGLGGFPNLVPYCASKFAVRGLLESLHEELRTDKKCNIKTTTVFPYMVDTGLCKNPRIKFDLFMKMIQPEEVAECVMMAQRREELLVSIPGYLINLQNFVRLCPPKAQMKLIDLLDSGIDSDLIREPVKN